MLGGCPHPLRSGVQPVLSPLCCPARGPSLAGGVSPARPHPVLLPRRSWSGRWSRTARTRSPLPSTPLPPTRARRSAAATPARRPPRRPGEPPAPRRGCTAPSARAGQQIAGARGALPRVSWPRQGASGVSSLELGETKPREMNEAHSWLKNPSEALKSEQLKRLGSRSGSAWNGKNQLLEAGSARPCSKTPGAGRPGPRAPWRSVPETSGQFGLLLPGR